MARLVVAFLALFAAGCAIADGDRSSKGTARVAAHELFSPSPHDRELKFSEFFVTPIGPRGLTLTEKLRSLDGKRVRIVGYMVQQERHMPGRFLLTSRPVQVHEEHYGLADDLPAATVHILMPNNTDQLLPYTPRPLFLKGTLSIGTREEPDGRISIVRLILDSPPAGPDRRR